MSDKFAMAGAGEQEMPQCLFCAHRIVGLPIACPAFPLNVPIDILTNEFDHRQPYPGDNGVMFVPEPWTTDDDLAKVAGWIASHKKGD